MAYKSSPTFRVDGDVVLYVDENYRLISGAPTNWGLLRSLSFTGNTFSIYINDWYGCSFTLTNNVEYTEMTFGSNIVRNCGIYGGISFGLMFNNSEREGYVATGLDGDFAYVGLFGMTFNDSLSKLVSFAMEGEYMTSEEAENVDWLLLKRHIESHLPFTISVKGDSTHESVYNLSRTEFVKDTSAESYFGSMSSDSAGITIFVSFKGTTGTNYNATGLEGVYAYAMVQQIEP